MYRDSARKLQRAPAARSSRSSRRSPRCSSRSAPARRWSAVGSFDRFPAEVEKLPRVGALLDPDLERILSLRPDLVVIYGSQTDLQHAARRAHEFPSTPTARRAGRCDGDDPGARRAGRARGGRRRAGRTASSRGLRPSGSGSPACAGRGPLLVFGREPMALRGIYASGGVGFLHDMLEVAGGENVFADVKRQAVQATTELILARRPDVILELRGGSDSLRQTTRARDRQSGGRSASVPAVRNGRVHLIGDPSARSSRARASRKRSSCSRGRCTRRRSSEPTAALSCQASRGRLGPT